MSLSRIAPATAPKIVTLRKNNKKSALIDIERKSPQDYSNLPVGMCAGSRICFVTTEFHGLFRNGGIGTANTGLATTLASAGFTVTVAYAAAPMLADAEFKAVQENYADLGIELEYVPAPKNMWQPFDEARSASYAVYCYLRDKEFDIVYFNDCGGHAYYSILAKHTGAYHPAPTMIVVTHGPHEWLQEINLVRYYNSQPVIISFLERRSVELADIVISPSAYLLRWLTNRGWKLPKHVYVEQNIVPAKGPPSRHSLSALAVRELVFFGRQETRKGLKLFCDALDRLSATLGDLRRFKITFLGKFSWIEGLHSGAYILERSKKWATDARFLVKKSQEEAIRYLQRDGALAVIPSLAENSPCVVVECIQHSIPFIATNAGGTAELVDPANVAHCLAEPTAKKLAEQLQQLITSGQPGVTLAVPQAITADRWLKFHQVNNSARNGSAAAQAVIVQPTDRTDVAPKDTPLVSICLVHYNSPDFIHQSLGSALSQDYPNFEVIIIDDGSSDPRALAALREIENTKYAVPVRVVRQDNRYLGAARNTGVRNAAGSFFLFLDDDNVLMPRCLSVYMEAMRRTGADIITSVPLQFRHNRLPQPERDGEVNYLPIGGCIELGAFENCFGDANALISKAAFAAVGGFHEDYGKAVEDWQFFATAALIGLRLEVVPEPIYWYRVRPSGMLNSSNLLENHRRILRLYREYPIHKIENIIEGLIDVESQHMHRLHQQQRKDSQLAQELIQKISRTDVNSAAAMSDFARLCVEQGRISEALDFTLQNNLTELGSLIGQASDSLERTALQIVDEQRLEIIRRLDLTEVVRRGAIAALGLEAEALERPRQKIAVHSLSQYIAAVQARAVCPTGTVRVIVNCSFRGSDSDAAMVRVAVARTNSQIEVTPSVVRGGDPDLKVVNGEAWWSEWTLLRSGETRKVLVEVGNRYNELQDLLLIARHEGGGSAWANVVWEHCDCYVSSKGGGVGSTITLPRGGVRVPQSAIEKGVLVAPLENPGFTVFRPEQPALLHPVHRQVALVRFAELLPAGARGIRAAIYLGDERAHPVDFGIWLCRPTTSVASFDDLKSADLFSGWYSVSEANRTHHLGAGLAGAAEETMDVYIGTRVVDVPNVYFCHAFWDQFEILE